MRNKDKLYDLGYRTFNMEWCCDSDFSMIKQAKASAERDSKLAKLLPFTQESFYSMLNQCRFDRLEFLQAWSDCVESIESDKRWSIRSIDLPAKRLMGKQLSDIKKLKAKREMGFADHISQSSDQFSGGSITIIENAHNTVYDHLKKINPVCAETALFITLEKFTKLSWFKVNDLEGLNNLRKSHYDSNTAKRITAFNSYFPEGSYLSTDYTSDKTSKTNEMDKKIFQNLVLSQEQVDHKKLKEDIMAAPETKGVAVSTALPSTTVTTTLATAESLAIPKAQTRDLASGQGKPLTLAFEQSTTSQAFGVRNCLSRVLSKLCRFDTRPASKVKV